MRYGLSEAQYAELVKVISFYDEIEAAVLFGSRAMETYLEASDVDVAILGPDVDYDVAYKVKRHMEDATDQPFFFDIVPYPKLKHKNLKSHIRRRGQLIFRRGWKEVRLGDVCEVRRGSVITREQTVEGDVPVIAGGTGPAYYHNTPNRCGPVITVSGSGANAGFVNFFRRPIYASDCSTIQPFSQALKLTQKTDHASSNYKSDRDQSGRAGRLSPLRQQTKGLEGSASRLGPCYKHDGVDTEAESAECFGVNSDGAQSSTTDVFYIYCVLKSMQQKLYDSQKGTTQPHVYAKDLMALITPHPPIVEQQSVAEVLSSLDDKIDLLHRQNKTLEAMAEALFHSWFVNFAPVRAKMEGRHSGLPADIAKLFPNRMVDSPLGPIPEGWEVQPLVESFNLVMGQSPPGSTYNDSGDGLPFFQGRAEFDFRFPKNKKFCTEPTRIAQRGDTLVSVRAPVGDVNMAWEKCCIGRGVAALKHKSDSISFTYYSVRGLQNNIRVYEHDGTVFGAITKQQFEQLTSLQPSRQLVQAFDSCAGAMDDRIMSNTTQIRLLTSLKNTLLPRLVSGQLRVSSKAVNTQETR